MAGNTIDPRLILEIESGSVFPAVTRMARRAARLICGEIAAKRVQNMLFAQRLVGGRIVGFPCPVDGARDLLSRFCVARKAGFRYIRCRLKRPAQFLNFA